jgi:hypothetical protein
MPWLYHFGSVKKYVECPEKKFSLQDGVGRLLRRVTAKRSVVELREFSL